MFFFLFIALSFSETFNSGVIYVTNYNEMYKRFKLGECVQESNVNFKYEARTMYDEDSGDEKIEIYKILYDSQNCPISDDIEEVLSETFKGYSTEITFYDSDLVIIPTDTEESIENLDNIVKSEHLIPNECFEYNEMITKYVVNEEEVNILYFNSLDDCLNNQNIANSLPLNCGANSFYYMYFICGYDADDYVTTGTIYANHKDNDASGYFEVHLGTCFYSEKNGNDDIYMEFVKQGNNYITLSYKNSECEGVPYPEEFGGEALTQKPATEVKVAILADDVQCKNKIKDEVGAILYYAVDKCLQVMEGQYVKTALANNKFSITYHTDAQCKNPYVSTADKNREFICNACNTGYYADCDLSDGTGIECFEEKHEKLSDDKQSCVCVDGYEKKTDKCSKICLEKDNEKTSQDGESCVCVDGYEKKDGKCEKKDSGAFSTFILAILAILFFFF